MTQIYDKVVIRNGTESQWVSNNPVLLEGEVGITMDKNPKKFKIGNGTLTWSELPYHNPSVTISNIQGLQEILDNKVTVPTQAEWDNFRLTLQG